MEKDLLERIYFWFRPRMEKKLFELLKVVSENADLSLDTMLRGVVLNFEYPDSILLKPAVDAFFYKHTVFFDAADTAILGNCGLGQFIKPEVSVRCYIKKLARCLKKAGVHDIQTGDLTEWRKEWRRMQYLGKKICSYKNYHSCGAFEAYDYDAILRKLGVRLRYEYNGKPLFTNDQSRMAYYLQLAI